jgi:glutamine cyclotransferase
LPDRFFGEGITVFGDKLIQLTWRSGSGFVYDKWTFKLLRTFHYTTEGWGITHDGKRLIMSDGTEHLYFLNPETFRVTGHIEVIDNDSPITRLNELEYVRGEIYANVWRTNNIAIINPESGRVKGWIDLESLSHLAGGDKAVKTLNGIAYDSEKERLFVTGKLWPKIYEIDLIPPRVKP